MNKITLIGNLIKDPAIKPIPSGQTLCEFTIAVNRKEWKTDEVTSDLFRINAWRKLGELCAKYLEKGRKVAVIGELKASTYIDKEGVARISLDVNADEVEFLTPKGDDQGSTYSAPTAPRPQQNRNQDVAGFTDISSDDIPF